MEDPGPRQKRERSASISSDDVLTKKQKADIALILGETEVSINAVSDPFNAAADPIIFVVGPGKSRIMAHRTIIEYISPKLRDEIQQITDVSKTQESIENPVELQLPEENPCVVMVFCCLAHSVRLRDYDTASPSIVLALAVFLVKYECNHRLYYSVHFYLSLSQYCADAEAQWKLFVASYLLRTRTHFQYYSSRLISSYRGSFLPFAKFVPDAELAMKLCLALEEQRSSGQKSHNFSRALCITCFDQAATSFLPNQHCASCQRLSENKPSSSTVLGQSNTANRSPITRSDTNNMPPQGNSSDVPASYTANSLPERLMATEPRQNAETIEHLYGGWF